MSLADLPDELIAHVAYYLSFSDVRNLMETNKKNYNAIKQRGKDKPKVDRLEIILDNDKLACSASLNQLNVNKTLYLKDVEKFENPFDALKIAVRESSFIEELSLRNWKIDCETWKFLDESKKKIGHMSMKYGEVDLSAEEFILLCQTYKETKFDEVQFNALLWKDQVLEEVIPYSTITKRSSSVVHSGAELITDRTLKALIGEKTVQRNFAIKNVCNSFTLKEILKQLEVIDEREIVPLDWKLGLLNNNQMAEAQLHFTENYGHIGRFKYEKWEENSCITYDLTLDLNDHEFNIPDSYWYDDADETIIYFAVSKF